MEKLRKSLFYFKRIRPYLVIYNIQQLETQIDLWLCDAQESGRGKKNLQLCFFPLFPLLSAAAGTEVKEKEEEKKEKGGGAISME